MKRERTIVITGAASGLGAALAAHMCRETLWTVVAVDKHASLDCDHSILCDVTSPPDIRDMVRMVEKHVGGVDVLVNCAGINGLSYIETMAEDLWDSIMDTNAKGMFLVTQALLPLMLRDGMKTVCNVVSNASHMPMTCSLAYNASKGAAHIMTLQMARELSRLYKGFTVFGISPNKLHGTGMSRRIEEDVCRVRGWTPEHAQAYQLNSLLAGEETDPAVVAEFMAFLLTDKARHKYLTGCILPYGA